MNTEERIECLKAYIEFLNAKGYELELKNRDALMVLTKDGKYINYYFEEWNLLLWRESYYELLKSSENPEYIITFIDDYFLCKNEFEKYYKETQIKETNNVI